MKSERNNPMGDRDSIVQSFQNYFDIRLANTDALKKIVYKIRYDVYCAELGWEKGCPVDVEKDIYDEHSVYCLLEHRRTQKFAGCIRLVTASDTMQLPFEVNCKAAIDTDIIDPSTLNRVKIGEVSRLAVPEEYRKRKNDEIDSFSREDDSQRRVSKHTQEERHHFPNIALGLYLSSFAYADLLGFEYVFVMMEPRLRRHLRRYGIVGEKGGKAIDYHGVRGLFYVHMENQTRYFSDEILEFYQWVHTRVKQQM